MLEYDLLPEYNTGVNYYKMLTKNYYEIFNKKSYPRITRTRKTFKRFIIEYYKYYCTMDNVHII